VAEGATLEDCYGAAPAVQVRNGALDVALPARAVAIYR
jgi:hypothetical protein